MTLSLHKLEKALNKQNIILRKIYTMDGLCIYLELLCISTAEICMMYIPSKYEIKAEYGDICKISYVNINEDGSIPEDYGEEPDNFDLENTYDEVDINIDLSHKDMAGHLEESYKHPLSLKDMNKGDKSNLREIFRQLRRLKFCVQNLKYKLCILYKGYLCCIRRDDTFECYHTVTEPDVEDKRTLVVTLDLETFYTKTKFIKDDIKTVKDGIYNVLDKNQVRHTQNLHKILEFKTTLITTSSECLKKKGSYSIYITKMEGMLRDLDISERDLVNKLNSIEERYANDRGLKGIHKDIEKSNILSKHENELKEINTVRQEIIGNLMNIKEKRETLSLKVDKICFDNTVMLDAILKNFELLKEL
jgi:hypothetical protein